MPVEKPHFRVSIVNDAHALGGYTTHKGANDHLGKPLWPKYESREEAVDACHHFGKNDRRAILLRVTPTGRELKQSCFAGGRVFAWDRKDECWYDVESDEWAAKVGLSEKMRRKAA